MYPATAPVRPAAEEPVDRAVVDDGEQKKTNYALRASTKELFFDLVTEGQPPAPGYFVYNAILNRQGRELLDESQMPPR